MLKNPLIVAVINTTPMSLKFNVPRYQQESYIFLTSNSLKENFEDDVKKKFETC